MNATQLCRDASNLKTQKSRKIFLKKRELKVYATTTTTATTTCIQREL